LLSTRSFVLWRDYNTTTAERIGWLEPTLLFHPNLFVVSSQFHSVRNCLIWFLSCPVDAKRSLMLVRRSPGPYEDRWGPVVVGSIFVLSLVAQFCIFIAASVHSNKLSWITECIDRPFALSCFAQLVRV
jgi:hypothetical protein